MTKSLFKQQFQRSKLRELRPRHTLLVKYIMLHVWLFRLDLALTGVVSYTKVTLI